MGKLQIGEKTLLEDIINQIDKSLYLSGEGSPLGRVAGDSAGQRYYDTITSDIWYCKSPGNSDTTEWVLQKSSGGPTGGSAFAYENVSHLKMIDTENIANTKLSVLGYLYPGDGGGGDFYYDPDSQACEDFGSVFIPNSKISRVEYDPFMTGDGSSTISYGYLTNKRIMPRTLAINDIYKDSGSGELLDKAGKIIGSVDYKTGMVIINLDKPFQAGLIVYASYSYAKDRGALIKVPNSVISIREFGIFPSSISNYGNFRNALKYASINGILTLPPGNYSTDIDLEIPITNAVLVSSYAYLNFNLLISGGSTLYGIGSKRLHINAPKNTVDSGEFDNIILEICQDSSIKNCKTNGLRIFNCSNLILSNIESKSVDADSSNQISITHTKSGFYKISSSKEILIENCSGTNKPSLILSDSSVDVRDYSPANGSDYDVTVSNSNFIVYQDNLLIDGEYLSPSSHIKDYSNPHRTIAEQVGALRFNGSQEKSAIPVYSDDSGWNLESSKIHVSEEDIDFSNLLANNLVIGKNSARLLQVISDSFEYHPNSSSAIYVISSGDFSLSLPNITADIIRFNLFLKQVNIGPIKWPKNLSWSLGLLPFVPKVPGVISAFAFTSFTDGFWFGEYLGSMLGSK